MGDIQCDILSGVNIYCIFVRFVDTTNQKITSFKSTIDLRDPEIYGKFSFILFYSGTLPTFPSELSEFFPNLKCIEIYKSNMKTICANDLRGFPKLEKLKLDFNQISYLPGDLFQFTPKIKQISFVNNKIRKINDKIFDNLNHLIEVDLRRNPNIDHKYNIERENIEIMKKIIQEKCKPIESLKDLSMAYVCKKINYRNVDDILMIAKHLKMDLLYRSACLYLELD